MELWSKGLGNSTLNLRLGKATVENCRDSLVIKGTMGPPVYWEYTITMTREDLDDILYIATQKGTISHLLDTEHRVSLYLTAVKQSMKVIAKLAVELLRRLFSLGHGKEDNSDASLSDVIPLNESKNNTQ